MKQLLEKIKSRKATIGVIGMGYVGLPLVLEFCDRGFPVVGFDVDPAKVDALKAGRSYIKHIASERIAAAVATGRFEVSTDFDGLARPDAVIICVPTPLSKQREPDMTYVEASTREIAGRLRKGQLVVLESTTYPGTTDELVQPILEAGGLKAGVDFWLAFSPEREDPGNPVYTTSKIPKVVGGLTPEALKLAVALYGQVVERTVPVSSTRTAEAVKLTENIFRSVNIALVNELKMIFDRMGIDVWEVIEAAKTKPFGYMPFYPGPGLGGHCIPIDPFYLTWKAREYECSTRFIELAGEVNTGMPAYVVGKLVDALNDRGKSLKGTKVLLLGIAYKKDVDDMRESPSLRLLELLLHKGATVDFYDPYIPVIPPTREFSHLAGMRSIEWNLKALSSYDVALVATAHSCVDYGELVKRVPLVVDARNATADVKDGRDRIVKA